MSGADGQLRPSEANKFEHGFMGPAPSRPVLAKYYRPPSRLKKNYAIIFTPRSGSTWLTHKIASYQVLSCPNEYFNAGLFMESLRFNPAQNIYEYFDIVAEKMTSKNGVFGFEISYFDLEELEKETELLSLMRGQNYFIRLTRRNFVAQAISMHIAHQSGLYHVVGESRKAELAIRPVVAYDSAKIRFWAAHILQQEYGITRWLTKKNLTVLDILYEDLETEIDRVVERIASYLNETITSARVDETPQTSRVTAGYALAYERRFRAEFPKWCHDWSMSRGQMPCHLDHAPFKIAER